MNRIKVILEEKQMTQVELSNRLEKSYNMVNSYVQNRRQPSIELLYKIADLLEVSVKELLIEKK
jgi:putative transcriptional regulator